MKSFPKVFIIILNYNGYELIRRCLSSVFKIEYSNFEVVVVDNCSTDGSFELAKTHFGKASFIRNQANMGFSAGNNAGIRFALERRADYVLLLNNDTEVEKEFLLKLVEAAESERRIGVVSPVIFDASSREVWFSGGVIDWWRMKALHCRDIDMVEQKESQFISGCAMLIKADVFKSVGLLDEQFFLYWEDVDFSLRSRMRGYKNMVVRSSWVYHFEKSERNREQKTYWLVLSGLLFFRKHTPWFFRPWVAFYLMLRKTKNAIDVTIGRGSMAKIVQKAYQDFKHADL